MGSKVSERVLLVNVLMLNMRRFLGGLRSAVSSAFRYSGGIKAFALAPRTRSTCTFIRTANAETVSTPREGVGGCPSP